VITRKATAALREADPVMARLVDEHTAAVRRDLRRERPGDAYGTLVRAIVGQQLSTRAAATIFGVTVQLSLLPRSMAFLPMSQMFLRRCSRCRDA